MRCLQPKERPEVPQWIQKNYSNAVVRKARTTHYCDGRVFRCISVIGPGDYYVAPGLLDAGVQIVWCLRCCGVRVGEEKSMSKKTRVVNLKNEECDVRIDRTTKWGNPFFIGPDGHGDRDEVCDKYEARLLKRVDLLRSLEELRGKRLGCWCKPLRCHGDTLVRFLEEGIPWRPVPKKRIRRE